MVCRGGGVYREWAAIDNASALLNGEVAGHNGGLPCLPRRKVGPGSGSKGLLGQKGSFKKARVWAIQCDNQAQGVERLCKSFTLAQRAEGGGFATEAQGGSGTRKK